MLPLNEYKRSLADHQSKLVILKKRYNLFSFFRLSVAVVGLMCFYFYFQTEDIKLIAGLLCFSALFLFILKRHQKIDWERKMEDRLIAIHQDEITHIETGALPFQNGQAFIDPSHPYSYDLDVFGNHSLYQFLNRTETVSGNKQLAKRLSSNFPEAQIIEIQLSVKELKNELAWRNRIRGLAQANPDDENSMQALKDWLEMSKKQIPPFLIALAYITPFIVIATFIAYLVTDLAILWKISGLGFVLNLLALTTQMPRIKMEVIPSVGIDQILKQYGLILKEIEEAQFKSDYLVELQQRLMPGKPASQSIGQLSTFFTRMEHVLNIFASPILNGALLYHIHQFKNLIQWRKEHAGQVEKWLEVIGTFEALNSLANFSFNNPDYIFPELNKERKMEFSELGHPLIRSDKRITNDVCFNKERFFILTGSNMSGKSTFLRTLGINMILTNAGGAVCAKEANIHALPILVSMRLADSLSDSESYFFAEVKRLKEIMDSLSEHVHFVLLDEILRGTNSDDKRSGTIAVVKKMVEKEAIGLIATHDLEVCNTINEYPGYLSNKRFEVEIINDELAFDYKLREGICENKSATFLMKKMEVID